MLSRFPLAYTVAFIFCDESGLNELTWTGRRSFAAAIRFWASTVIHSTCRCHSGGTVENGGGGGARMAPVRLEYVTKRERRIDNSAGRRSSDKMMSPRDAVLSFQLACTRIGWIELVSAQFSQ